MSVPTYPISEIAALNPVSVRRAVPLAVEITTISDPGTTKPSHKRDEGGEQHQQLSVLEESLSHEVMKNVQVSYDRLDSLELKLCLLFLSIFPKNEVLKKRPLIYWWIGEGLINTEEEGERIFEELLKSDLIMPCGKSKSLVVSKCKILPWNRRMLISQAKQAQLFDFDSKGTPLFQTQNSRRACLTEIHDENSPLNEKLRTIFNVNKECLDFEAEWIEKLKNLVVLQLGRWQKSPTKHIEVQSEAFLKGLRTQKHLKYLSLRGMSRITELPPSIAKLVSLEILDLKACHNLEKLPDNIASLRKLTHLDVSECYFLESMPKGLEKLTSLQVLKGFIIGNSKKANPCSIGDLANFKKLRRLSIYIGSEAMVPDAAFVNLSHISSLRCLRISCSVISTKLEEQVKKKTFSFPPSLEKLDLEGVPHEKAEWLVPSKLKKLKELSVKGGKLTSLEEQMEDKWTVEILRLKYLKYFKTDQLSKLKELFPLAVINIKPWEENKSRKDHRRSSIGKFYGGQDFETC